MSREEDKILADKIAERIDKEGGKAFLVGGCVRDMLLRIDSKDIDIEIHGIKPDRLKEILKDFGEFDERKVGESFGILALKGHDIDISMPRKEVPTMPNGGHKDFSVFVDPFIGEEEAARRRDFTINAMMHDLITGEILDFFHGIEDLENGIIRHVDAASFADDPLRVLRAAQFAARFGFSVAPETIELCSKMDLSKLPHERIAMELTKALMKAQHPSVFFNVLRDMGQLDLWFPEVAELIETPQNEKHHMEGDVYNHTMLVIDEAAKYREDVWEPKYFMVAALCHDFGKPSVTEFSEEKKKWTALGHDVAGEKPARDFVRRIYNDKDMEEYVANMVRLHMQPLMLMKSTAKTKSYMHLIDKALLPEDLVVLTRCDNDGKISEAHSVYDEDKLWKMCAEYELRMAKPHVTGSDLKRLGYQEGPIFKEILDFAHKLQLAGVEKPSVIKQIVGTYKTAKKKE